MYDTKIGWIEHLCKPQIVETLVPYNHTSYIK